MVDFFIRDIIRVVILPMMKLFLDEKMSVDAKVFGKHLADSQRNHLGAAMGVE